MTNRREPALANASLHSLALHVKSIRVQLAMMAEVKRQSVVESSRVRDKSLMVNASVNARLAGKGRLVISLFVQLANRLRSSAVAMAPVVQMASAVAKLGGSVLIVARQNVPRIVLEMCVV
jgi:hypothetical protein